MAGMRSGMQGVGSTAPVVMALVVAMLVAPAPAGAQDARARAAALANSAVVLARSGDSVEALALYEKAYELDPDPTLLYNIGRVAEKAGRPARAAEALRAFLDHETDPELRARAQETLDRVSALLPEAPPAPATPSSAATLPTAANDLTPAAPAPVVEPSTSVSGLPGWAWALIGTGAAALVGGGVATYLLLRDGGSSADHAWTVR